MTEKNWVNYINESVGWISMALWTFGFFLKSYVIYKTKTGDGTAWDYLFMNWVSFFLYLSYCIFGYFYTQASYYNEVHLSDLVFVCFALLMCSVEILQVYYYPRSKNIIRWPLFALTVGAIISTVVICIQYDVEFAFQYMGYMKILLTNIRSFPQMYLNYKRKSTRGWSMTATSLDLFGALLSLVQLFIDWTFDRYKKFWEAVNVPKLFLGVMSIVYDCIFLFQHYGLGYRNNNPEFREQKSEIIVLKDDIVDLARRSTGKNIRNPKSLKLEVNDALITVDDTSKNQDTSPSCNSEKR